MIYELIMLLGTLKMLHAIYRSVKFYIRHFQRQPLDLKVRYGGDGVWALVTGASDGIGAEFCKQLAEKGFNLIMIARTDSKLRTVADACKKINPKIET